MARPIFKRRLYLKGKTGQYYEFRVWRTLREMREHCTWTRVCNKTRGLCSTHTVVNVKTGKRRVMPNIGEINLLERYVTAEVVAHELQHAVLGWAKEAQIDPLDTSGKDNTMAVDCGQERVCYAMGHMMRQAVNALHRGGVWR